MNHHFPEDKQNKHKNRIFSTFQKSFERCHFLKNERNHLQVESLAKVILDDVIKGSSDF